MKKFKGLLIAALLLVSSAKLFAADATVTFVSGKVEVLRNEKWVPLQKGDTVAKSEMVSTGFQSEAKIKILDSVMYLGPVTRITIEELSTSGKKDNVNVYLKTGTARSQVKHVDNKRVDYKVHTAIAVASCRGTDWTMDDTNAVECYEGIVAVSAYNALEFGEFDNTYTDMNGDEGEEGDEGETIDSVSEPAVPTTADGILVKANQTIKVLHTTEVSAPVSNVLKLANSIVSAVGSASAKESVSAVVSSSNAVTATEVTGAVRDALSDVLDLDKDDEEPVKTGSVVVTFEMPE